VNVTNLPFVHLGSRSDASSGESLASVEDLCWEASRDQQGFLALTDVCSLGRAAAFAHAAARSGLRPIFGAELNVLPVGETQYRGTTFRVRIIVENERGWRTAVRLVTAARRAQSASRPPFISLAALIEDPRGLVFLVGGERGELTRALLAGDFERAELLVSTLLKKLTPESLFVELSRPDGATTALRQVAGFFGLTSVVVPGVRVANAAMDPLFALMAGKRRADGGTPELLSDLLRPVEEREYLAPRHLLEARFAGLEDALAATLALAERCAAFILPQPESRFPVHDFHRGVDAESYIWNTAFARATERYGDLPTRYKERLNREFREIVEAGLANAVVSLVRLNAELEAEGVQRGPGAGLFTNSLIASLLGLTKVDPLKFDLNFELAPGLTAGSFPLLEVSIPASQEPLAIGALAKLFEGQVLPVGEWRVWKTGALLEAAAEALGKDAKWATQTARSAVFQRAREAASALGAAWMPDSTTPLLSAEFLGWFTQRLEGRLRDIAPQQGTYCFTVEPMEQSIPARLTRLTADSTVPGLPVSEWTSAELEKLRHGRISFVHPPLLDLIGEATDLARAQGDPSYAPEHTPPDDPDTYGLFRDGRTAGILPLESPQIRQRLRQGQPTDLHSLIRLLRGEGRGAIDFASILLCHVCASLKAQRPAAFYAAALSQAGQDVRRAAVLVDEASTQGLRINEVDINYSTWRWAVEKDALRPGFLVVHGVTAAAGAEIMAKRREMHFASIEDLCARTDRSRLRASALVALAKAGAFDSLGDSRADVLEQIARMHPSSPAIRKLVPGLSGADEIPGFFDQDSSWFAEQTEDTATAGNGGDETAKRRAQEQEVIGFALREMPGTAREYFLRDAKVKTAARLVLKDADRRVTLLGIASSLEADPVHPGTIVADVGGCLVMAKGSLAKDLGGTELAGTRCLLTGNLRRETFQWVLELEAITSLENAIARAAEPQAIRLDLSHTSDSALRDVDALLKAFPGNSPTQLGWLPEDAPRLLHRIGARRVLVCPMLEQGLLSLIGPEAWELQPLSPEDAESTRQDGLLAGIGRVLRRAFI